MPDEWGRLGGSEMALWVLMLVAAYFIGNLSPATLVSRAAGVDIRSSGSGNPGTTNVLRVMGKKAAALTLSIDVLKGVLPVLAAKAIGGNTLAAFAGLAVFLGHCWPVIYRFKGGKGIATGLGLLLALDWRMGLLCLLVAAAGFVLTRRISPGSLLAAAALPFLAWHFLPEQAALLAVMAALVFVKHRGNIKRLIKGEEPPVNFRRKG